MSVPVPVDEIFPIYGVIGIWAFVFLLLTEITLDDLIYSFGCIHRLLQKFLI